MPTAKRVTLSKEQVCTKCKRNLGIGDVVVKDRRDKKRIGTIYYHTECPTKVG